MSSKEERILEKLDDLEMRIVFQDDLLQQLDEALSSQQRQLMDMQEQFSMLVQQLTKLEHALPEGPEAPPPHY